MLSAPVSLLSQLAGCSNDRSMAAWPGQTRNSAKGTPPKLVCHRGRPEFRARRVPPLWIAFWRPPIENFVQPAWALNFVSCAAAMSPSATSRDTIRRPPVGIGEARAAEACIARCHCLQLPAPTQAPPKPGHSFSRPHRLLKFNAIFCHPLHPTRPPRPPQTRLAGARAENSTIATRICVAPLKVAVSQRGFSHPRPTPRAQTDSPKPAPLKLHLKLL